MMTAAAPACSAYLAFSTNSHVPRSIRTTFPATLALLISGLQAILGSETKSTYSGLGRSENGGLKVDSRIGKLVDWMPLMETVPVYVTYVSA